MTYSVLTQDNLAKWWITGTGSVVNRLSEVMDDAPDGPAIYHLDADNDWTSGVGAEWYVATATKPDNVSENLAGWRNMTDAGDDQDGVLNVDEWSYDTGNNRVYVRLSDSSDANATDVRCDYDWDGAGAGPAFMTETVEDRIYLIHLSFDVGDGATSTTLVSTNEYVYFDDGQVFIIKNSATLTQGALVGDYGIAGSHWSLFPTANLEILANPSTGTHNMYASTLHNRNATNSYGFHWYGGTFTMNYSHISGESVYRGYCLIRFSCTASLTNVYFYRFATGLSLSISPATFLGVHTHSCDIGLQVLWAVGITVTADGVLSTSSK